METDYEKLHVRDGRPEERPIIKIWGKTMVASGELPRDLVHDFDGTWGRLGHPAGSVWTTDPPVLILSGEKIVGLGAAKYTDELYVNSYYSMVVKAYRGRGIGRWIFESKLRRAAKRGMKRWTVKTKIGGDGERFYRKGLGIEPLGRSGDLLVFDFNIAGMRTVDEIKKAVVAGIIFQPEGIPMSRIKRYAESLEMNRECLIRGWKEHVPEITK